MIRMESYKERILQTLAELEIPARHAEECRLPIHLEGEDLISVGLDMFQRDQRMDRPAAAQWQAMVEAARHEGVELLAVSAFRSFDYQKGIIQRKLKAGLSIEKILSASALPGYSEHHTGRAMDIGANGSEPLTEDFERTDGYAWLDRRAREFGFRLSYPRDNELGIIYEPWHWFFKG